MFWLTKLATEILAVHPEGEIIIESGGSPSGTHHLGHLRELLTSDAILQELKSRGRQARHIYFVDDLDALRKIPVNVPPGFEEYLGKPLCDIPSPDGSDGTYADYFLNGLIEASRSLGMEIEFVRSHEKYRNGFFVPAIEKALAATGEIRGILENISGHKLGDEWSPIQVNEDGYLKKRRFVSIDTQKKELVYEDRTGQEQSVSYADGQVKLDWRIDWPARWWLMDVAVEPFGRDHATKGGSYDTGAQLVRRIFGAEPPFAVAYDFVNLAGDTKKMSASKGTGLDAEGVVKVLPPEIVSFFMLRFPPAKRLYFDPANGVAQLIDEFAALMQSEPESPVLAIAQKGVEPKVTRIPFTHLVATYQASLKDPAKTIELLSRTGYEVEQDHQALTQELEYIDEWLRRWAPEDVRFDLRPSVESGEFSQSEKRYLAALADRIANAPADADGEWFHKAIYGFKDSQGMSPEQLFGPLYRVLIGRPKGPRAGWFLSILPRDWLVKRLRLEA